MAGENIVLVDDDRVIQAMVGGFLRRGGYVVRVASNGVQALDLISEQLPDLVITDIRMPELNGIELTSRLRAHYRTARLPIVMFSELTEVEDALVGYSAGADEYLPKPFELTILDAKIRALLRRAAPDPSAASRGKVVVFAHAKGGVGTTALAVNVAAILAETTPGAIGLLDLDVEFGNAAAQLNLEPRYTLADLQVASGDVVDAEMFSRFVTESHHVRLVAAADRPERAAMVTLPAVQLAIDRLSHQCDYVLVDAAASFSEMTLTAIHASDLLLLVTSASRPALRATRDCLSMLRGMRLPVGGSIGLILNNATEHSMDLEGASAVLGRRPDFVVPRSENLDVALNTGLPLVTSHPTDSIVGDLRLLAGAVATAVQGTGTWSANVA
jgi:pilus assembly protein CpaE